VSPQRCALFKTPCIRSLSLPQSPPHQQGEAYVRREISMAWLTWANEAEGRPLAFSVLRAKSVWDALFKAESTWSVKLRFSLMVIPRNVRLETLGILGRGEGGRMDACRLFRGVIMSSADLLGLRCWLLIRHHSLIWSSSAAIVCELDAGTTRFTSSAYFRR
jgi:hypothetical protein